jgi:hypothetical protein
MLQAKPDINGTVNSTLLHGAPPSAYPRTLNKMSGTIVSGMAGACRPPIGRWQMRQRGLNP